MEIENDEIAFEKRKKKDFYEKKNKQTKMKIFKKQIFDVYLN